MFARFSSFIPRRPRGIKRFQENFQKMPDAYRAFTFIEILVVLVILSVVSAFVILSVSGNHDERALKERSQYLAELLCFTREQSLWLPATLGVLVTDQGLGFYEYILPDPLDLDTALWRRLTRDNLSFQSFDKSTHVRLTVAGQAQDLKMQKTFSMQEDIKPQIFFSMTGHLTPFILSFSKEDSDKQFNIIGQSNGEIRWEEKVLP
jgi:prepilin-type N-terminal cleavage/methylation domain-containing protein